MNGLWMAEFVASLCWPVVYSIHVHFNRGTFQEHCGIPGAPASWEGHVSVHTVLDATHGPHARCAHTARTATGAAGRRLCRAAELGGHPWCRAARARRSGGWWAVGAGCCVPGSRLNTKRKRFLIGTLLENCPGSWTMPCWAQMYLTCNEALYTFYPVYSYRIVSYRMCYLGKTKSVVLFD